MGTLFAVMLGVIVFSIVFPFGMLEAYCDNPDGD